MQLIGSGTNPQGNPATDSDGGMFIVTKTVDTMANCLDVGAMTNVPSPFYCVRLVP